MTENIQILVVEDDNSIRNLISTTLKINGYRYETAATGEEALGKCVMLHPDVMLLDLGLPDMDGNEIIRSVREWSTMPIIVISARSEDSSKVQALDLGADDYLTKPFSTEELIARLHTTQRRLSYLKRQEQESPVFTNGDMCIDLLKAEVRIRDEVVHLTPTEYKILKLLSENVGRVLTYNYMTDHIWGGELSSDKVSLRVHIATLRKKLGDAETEHPQIETHMGIGYNMIRYSET
ncbi:DNA-binding response regulator [Oribacterium sp. C9]|uniref:response regulator transcription factor n=1 Tax=Oribacterium sp. C9 TaxID=1943579 RepID=UPI00098FD3FE|nr:response regulator transcription factor [Oribacterium sp. C9]OON85945.1 DNA-binding response regulator [Oribacterium sp. C9]